MCALFGKGVATLYYFGITAIGTVPHAAGPSGSIGKSIFTLIIEKNNNK